MRYAIMHLALLVYTCYSLCQKLFLEHSMHMYVAEVTRTTKSNE